MAATPLPTPSPTPEPTSAPPRYSADSDFDESELRGLSYVPDLPGIGKWRYSRDCEEGCMAIMITAGILAFPIFLFISLFLKSDNVAMKATSWGAVHAESACAAWNAREYTAHLLDLPHSLDTAKKACETKAVEIQGISFATPNICEKTDYGGIVGHWFVPDSVCYTFWEEPVDQGCRNEPQTRYIEAKLSHLQAPYDNWKEMCRTTPSSLVSAEEGRPQTCRKDDDNNTVWGGWFIHDEECP